MIISACMTSPHRICSLAHPSVEMESKRKEKSATVAQKSAIVVIIKRASYSPVQSALLSMACAAVTHVKSSHVVHCAVKQSPIVMFQNIVMTRV